MIYKSSIAASVYLTLTLSQVATAQDLDERIASTVREQGVVEAAESVEIQCPLSGTATILWVAPEGSTVEKGDHLLTFDASAIEEQLRATRIEADRAKAEVSQARSEIAALEQRRLSIQRAQKLYAEAGRLQRRSMESEMELEKQKLEGELRVHRAALAATEAKREQWTRGDGDALPAELALEMTASKEALAATERQLKHLTSVIQPKQTLAHELAEWETKLKWEMEHEKVTAGLAKGKAAMVAKEAMAANAGAKVAELAAQAKAARVLAPQEGTVVYANQRSRTGGFIVEVGATVRERQTVLRLPDLSKLQLRVAVNETRIAQVKVGQRAEVTLDALPGRRIPGTVTKVSRTPRPSTGFLQQNVKEYDVTVRLSETPAALRLGMSGLVEIRTD